MKYSKPFLFLFVSIVIFFTTPIILPKIDRIDFGISLSYLGMFVGLSIAGYSIYKRDNSEKLDIQVPLMGILILVFILSFIHFIVGLRTVVFPFLLLCLVVAILEIHRKITFEKKEAILRQKSATAQLNSLQARLNPHFLYNSLNSIASLIKSEPDKAEEMTLSVSRFLKHFSNRESDHMTLFTEELEMIKEYLAIEKIRFGESLTYNINITAKAYDQLVPRSLLQPLVENAIKYGYSTDHSSVHISIDVTMQEHQMIISISDSGPAWDENLQKGYGLSSVYNKLSLIYGDDYDVSFVNDPEKKIVIIIATDKVKVYD